MPKGLIIHVGADTSNDDTLGIVGPIFEDGQFEFIPIVETNPGATTVRYVEIEGRSTQSRQAKLFLSAYVPAPLENRSSHVDPNPEGFSYSEPTDARRSTLLVQLEPDDYLFFVSSLVPYSEETYRNRDSRTIKNYQRGRMTKYLIGYFKIREVFLVDTAVAEPPRPYFIRIARNNEKIDLPLLSSVESQIRMNAHFLRPSDRFICAVGSKDGLKHERRESLLLPKAVPLTGRWPFRPLPFADSVYGSKNYPRGHKRIPNESRPHGLQTLLTQISQIR